MADLPWDRHDAGRAALTIDHVAELVGVAEALVDAAAVPALDRFRARDLDVLGKGGDGDGVRGAAGWDPVTEADRAAETAMRDVLATRRPDDGVVGEEHPATPGTSGLTWVLDPIDGTRAYVAGLPTWCVLVAVFDGREPVLGIIAQPFTDERWTGVDTGVVRRSTWRRGHTELELDATAGAVTDLGEAVLHTTFPEVGTAAERAGFERVRDRVRLTRYGGDAYGYALVASGTVDLVVEAGLAPHDVQALVPVVRGAGGVITDWAGGPCHRGGRVVAGSPAVHAAALDLLADRVRRDRDES